MAPFDKRRNPRNSPQILDLCRRLSRSLDLEPLLRSIVALACESTNSEASSILLMEEETRLLVFIAAPPAHQDELRRLRVPLEGSVAGRCFLQGRAVVLNNALNDSRVFRVPDRTLNFQTGSIAAVPLMYGPDCLGVVEAVNKKGRSHYTEEDVTILEILASQAAIAIQNARLAEEIQHAYRDVEELEHMKANFIAIASHELRTPLGLILGHGTHLRDHVQDAELKHQAQVVVDSAIRLNSIIEDLANIENEDKTSAHLERKTVHMDQLIQQVLASFADDARQKRVGVFTDFASSHITVEGDAEKIAIALGHLIKNALTFTDENGHILVTAENLPGYVKVSVVDDGIGIPATDLPRVFERFYQVESHMTRRHGGMGLGLSVAKVMVEMHGGQIWVESIEGKGSNFSFLLPSGKTRPLAAPTPAFEM